MNIILTSALSEKPIDEHHQFVCIGPNCWGIGQTAKEAYKNAKREGPSRYRGIFITRVAPKAGFKIDGVDGSVCWDGAKHNAAECKLCTVGKGIRITKE
ncbi:MAG TPA: hypothetical protein VFB72_18725 [Verrucomicrobiae bacterium]|nr:hypothetical protein [Verrucomicrobiae bacterium]